MIIKSIKKKFFFTLTPLVLAISSSIDIISSSFDLKIMKTVVKMMVTKNDMYRNKFLEMNIWLKDPIKA